MPHAWKPGAQTQLLRSQLEAMDNGGTVIISVPPNPYRCPPGPYERASLIAHYLKQAKPDSKILILDAKESFAKQELFMQGWDTLYPGMIEWVPGTMGGAVSGVDPKDMNVICDTERHTGDVINLIPPERAGLVAQVAELADESGWCPVDPVTFESTLQRGIHVIGDAAQAGKLPKSGAVANAEGKVCAAAVVALMNGKPVGAPSFINACYSLLAPDYAIGIAGVFEHSSQGITPISQASGASPLNVWPGCTQTHHLHIHHLKHWADGGATSVQNAASLCSSHHALVHEGGYTIQRVDDDDQRLHEQFVQQQHAADISQFDVEKALRNDKESFNTVRTLSPESYRFRVVDAQEQDIHNRPDADISDSGTRSTFGFDDYTHVYCSEPVPDYCHGRVRDMHAASFTSEAPAYYATNAWSAPNTLCH